MTVSKAAFVGKVTGDQAPHRSLTKPLLAYEVYLLKASFDRSFLMTNGINVMRLILRSFALVFMLISTTAA